MQIEYLGGGGYMYRKKLIYELVTEGGQIEVGGDMMTFMGGSIDFYYRAALLKNSSSGNIYSVRNLYRFADISGNGSIQDVPISGYFEVLSGTLSDTTGMTSNANFTNYRSENIAYLGDINDNNYVYTYEGMFKNTMINQTLFADGKNWLVCSEMFKDTTGFASLSNSLTTKFFTPEAPFFGCNDVFKGSDVTDMRNMEIINMYHWKGNVWDTNYAPKGIFANCTSLTHAPMLTQWFGFNLLYDFEGCTNLELIQLKNIWTVYSTYGGGNICEKLAAIVHNQTKPNGHIVIYNTGEVIHDVGRVDRIYNETQFNGDMENITLENGWTIEFITQI